MATIFFETRKKGNELVEPETTEKYVCLYIKYLTLNQCISLFKYFYVLQAEIHELVQSELSLTNIHIGHSFQRKDLNGCPQTPRWVSKVNGMVCSP